MSVGVVLVDESGHLHPRIVGVVINRMVPTLMVEIVVDLLSQGPHHGIGPEPGHPVTGKGLKGGIVGGESGLHVAGEEEFCVGMRQPLLRNVLVIFVGQLESRYVVSIHMAV